MKTLPFALKQLKLVLELSHIVEFDEVTGDYVCRCGKWFGTPAAKSTYNRIYTHLKAMEVPMIDAPWLSDMPLPASSIHRPQAPNRGKHFGER